MSAVEGLNLLWEQVCLRERKKATTVNRILNEVQFVYYTLSLYKDN